MSFDSTVESVIERRPARPARKARGPRLSEAAVWASCPGGWRQLYGSFPDLGISIEWHDFQAASAFDWSRSFHPGSLELCLNLSGRGVVCGGGRDMILEPLTAGFYLPGKADSSRRLPQDGLAAWRGPGEQHRFITVEFSARFLRERLSACDGGLDPRVEKFIQGGGSRAEIGSVHRLKGEQERLIGQFIHPPVAQAARGLWCQSKLLELMAECFFERPGENELLCDRQKRLARERVDRVIAVLGRRLAEPVSLGELGREVGCSPFYLSRTFSQEMGMTIPQYLRKLRMERAAELLRGGKHNVTEAALEVGYSSLSHFSQAFCATMGCCPGLYPMKSSS